MERAFAGLSLTPLTGQAVFCRTAMCTGATACGVVVSLRFELGLVSSTTSSRSTAFKSETVRAMPQRRTRFLAPRDSYRRSSNRCGRGHNKCRRHPVPVFVCRAQTVGLLYHEIRISRRCIINLNLVTFRVSSTRPLLRVNKRPCIKLSLVNFALL